MLALLFSRLKSVEQCMLRAQSLAPTLLESIRNATLKCVQTLVETNLTQRKFDEADLLANDLQQIRSGDPDVQLIRVRILLGKI